MLFLQLGSCSAVFLRIFYHDDSLAQDLTGGDVV